MKKLLAFLIFLLFLVLIWFGWNWYKTNVACCPETVAEVAHGPLYFDCQTDIPITSETWSEKKSEILSSKEDGKKLLIVGPYFDGETESIGLARAQKVKELFLDNLAESDMEIGARMAGDCEEAKKDALHHTMFKWVVRNENVVEHHDKTYIYFKYDTTKPIDTENVVTYLNDLIEYLKSSGQSVVLTGHTDADGDEQYNYELGLERANRVKDYMVERGVSEDKITVNSMGKKEPLSDNTTPEGKQRNRRVEIQIK